MTTPPSPSPPPRPPATWRDRREPAPGVVPRALQGWIMAGLALVIVGIIVMTGSPTPPERTSTAPKPEATRSVSPSRVESYQQAVDQRTRLLQEELARLREESASPSPDAALAADAYGVATEPEDPLRDEQRRREYQSLFAEVVVHTRRAEAERPSMQAAPPSGPAMPMGLPPGLPTFGMAMPPQAAVPSTPVKPPPAPQADRVRDRSARPSSPLPLTGDTHTLLEGTLIETVLTNRLDGTFSGPVHVLVTTPVYAHGGQTLVIPAGARLLGAASPVTTWGDTRLAVRFHRLMLPDGRTVSLEQVPGLNQIGETGLRDQVKRHYWQVFGASLAIGALGGLAQLTTRSGYDQTFEDAARQGMGTSLAQSAARVLDRYLNQLPTITIREGHRVKVWLTGDLTLPAWFDGRDRRLVSSLGGLR